MITPEDDKIIGKFTEELIDAGFPADYDKVKQAVIKMIGYKPLKSIPGLEGKGRREYIYNGDHCRNGYKVIGIMPRKNGYTAAMKHANEFAKVWRGMHEHKPSD